jgi:hypothetical protein
MGLMNQYGSLGVPQTPKSCDTLIGVFKFIIYMCKNKLHVCTYSTVRFTLRFVNLFVEVSRVCGAWQLDILIDGRLTNQYDRDISKQMIPTLVIELNNLIVNARMPHSSFNCTIRKFICFRDQNSSRILEAFYKISDSICFWPFNYFQ